MGVALHWLPAATSPVETPRHPTTTTVTTTRRWNIHTARITSRPVARSGLETLAGGDEEIDEHVGPANQHGSDEGNEDPGLASAPKVRVRAVCADGPHDGCDDQP